MWYLDTLQRDAAKVLETNRKKKLKRIKSLQEKPDHELLDYVYGLVKHMPLFQLHSTAYYRKCNEKSDTLRKEGNQLWIRESKWQDALDNFTKAVAYAEVGSETLSNAYSNRSHVFLDQRMYNECVKDIERALKCKYPEHLKEKLDKRREKIEEFKRCHQKIEYHDTIPTISPKNKSIQSASNSVCLEINAKWGRHVIAKRNIRIGEIITVETPYICFVNSEQQYSHCNECMELCFNMIGCDNCTEVMYCDEKCKKKAYDSYHKYECILIQHGLKQRRLFLRLTLKALTEYNQFIEDMKTNEDPVFRSDRYKEIYCMRNFKDLRSPTELFEASLEPVAFYHFLIKYTKILDDLQMDDKENVLKDLLFRNYLIWYANGIPIEKLKKKSGTLTYFARVGDGIFPFYANFHHSCFSNAVPIFYGSKLVMRAMQNIAKGDRVTTTFGITFMKNTKEDRKILLQRYNYNCECEACVQDWPLRGQLRQGTPVPRTLERRIAQFFFGDVYVPATANHLLQEAYKFYNTLKIPEVPTENFLLIRGIISDLILYLGNMEDLKE